MPFTMFNITTGIEFPNASPYKIKKLKKDEWRVYTENKNRG